MHKIMVVDDEVTVAMELEESLSGIGYDVVGRASSGEAAVDMARHLRPDLILMDIVMPGKVDGIDASDTIKKELNIPVIFLTAYAGEEYVNRAKKVEPFGYILKPFRETEVRANIEIAIRKGALERQLRESEEKSWSLVDNASDGIIFVDSRGRIVFWNKGAQSILDYASNEAVGKTLNFIISKRCREDIEERMRLVVSTTKSYLVGKPIECTGLRKNGSEFPMELSLASAKTKEELLFICVIRDVSERKLAEEALRKAYDGLEQRVEERTAELVTMNEELQREIADHKRAEDELRESRQLLKKTVDSLQEALFIINAETGEIMDCNRAASKIFGYSRDEMIGRTTDFLHVNETILEEFRKHLSRAVEEEGLLFLPEFRMKRKDGTAFSTEHTMVPFESDQSRNDGWVSIVCDITERIRVKDDLKRTTEQLSVLFESLPIALYSTKASGDFGITYVSSSVERITGYTPEEFTEDPTYWTKRIHPDDRDRVLAELPAQVMEDKHHVEYRFQIADGLYIWLSDTRCVVRLPDGTISHIVGLWQDITEEKRISQEAEYRLQQIVQADRLASLGKVVAGVAHEINNPNSFITYNVPILEETWQMFEPIVTNYAASHPEWRKSGMTINEFCHDMHEIIQAIKTGSERINKVVCNLKDFVRSKDESADAKPVQVNEVIEKTLSIVGSQVSKSVRRIELNLACNLPDIQGHAQKLEQVVANLVVNAVCAIPDKEKGRLSITTRYIERLKSVLIEIEDNGIGMKPGVVGRIFEPFFTTRRDAGGTGLGLSVSYGLIQEHNGIIGVLSRSGLGTRFTVFLPVGRDTRLDLHPSIFCVDDDVGFLSDLKMYFFDIKDMSFESTSNPDSVMAYLEEHPEVDIVLADIMMPGINGWELLEKIKAKFPLLTVILYTGYPSALKEKPYGGPEPDHLLQKPFKMEQMLELINIIGRQRL